jgi:uncharacterized protein (TIGR03437 family)
MPARWVVLSASIILGSCSALLQAAKAPQAVHDPARVLAEISLHRFAQEKHPQLFARARPAANADQGNIAVIEDDGTIVIPANRFNLDGKSVRFQPQSDGTYRVSAGATPIDRAGETGATVPLGDDDTSEISFGFPFRFFGQTYAGVFLNSDGNFTFTVGDVSTAERDLSRLLSGAPRIAPFLEDLDPSVGGRVTIVKRPDRVIFTWLAVPLWGAPQRQTFQAVLFADGGIEYIYAGIEGPRAVVGISPGHVQTPPALVVLSAQDGSRALSGAIAEVFSATQEFSTAAVVRRFYATHEDAYDFLVIFSNFSFNLGLAFAFELNIQNDVTGIGSFGVLSDTFDYSREYGSRGRLQSVLQMADMSRYPDDPRATLFFVSGDTTLSILGQEAGHRWLARLQYPFGSNPRSNILLGRDNAHWSFYFNSEASVEEGNEIRDNGDGSFTTTATVQRYGTLDQYVMGLRRPDEVTPSFVVTSPDLFFAPSHGPQPGVTFRGTKTPVTIDKVIAANGPRLPTAAVAPKDFNFAWILVTQKGTSPSPGQVAKLDRFRTEWDRFWLEATSQRSRIRSNLVKAVRWTALPAAALPGSSRIATLALESPAPAGGVTLQLQSSDVSVARVPASVTIPAGGAEASVTITAAANGVARLTATAAGYDIAEGVLAVSPASALSLAVAAGNQQVGAPGAPLSAPLAVVVRDPSGLAAVGVMVRFDPPPGGAVSPPSVLTDGAGRAEARLTLGPQAGEQRVEISLADAPAVRASFTAIALRAPVVPAGSAVHGATFAAARPIAPGSLFSIFGADLAGSTQAASRFPLPAALAGATVSLGGLTAPLLYASAGQLNAQAPFELPAGDANLVVHNGAAAAPPIAVTLVPAAPGIFTLPQDGTGAAAALHGLDFRPITPAAPARAGETITLFATGLGAVSPQALTGRPAPSQPLSTTVAAPAVSIGGKPATVQFSGLAPGFAGLYQLNVSVPDGVLGEVVPVTIAVSGASSNIATIAIR